MTSHDNSSILVQHDTREAIFRLAHFDPTYKDEYFNQLIDYLVLDALASYGPLIMITAPQVRIHIKKVFKLDFQEEEINASAKRLGQRGIVEYTETRRGENPHIKITTEIESKIKNNLAKIQRMETEIVEEWKQEICSTYKDFPVVEKNIESIIDNLQLFISKIVSRHGVECVALLYPEKRKTRQWLQRVESDILDALPKIEPFVDSIVNLEIPKFFKLATPKRRVYVTNLLNSSFFWHLIQVDQRCSNLLRSVTKGQRLYLDNNVLYSLVGFDGPNMLKASHTMLKLANELGYDLYVTNKTIDEFHDSLHWQMKELKQKPPLPRELARIAAEKLEKDGFLSCYWSEFVKSGVSIEEFVSERSHLDIIVSELGIKQTNKFRKEIEQSQELPHEESVLKSVCVSDLSDFIIEHDAFHRVFINKIRKGPKHHFADAVAWFLTYDGKLPVYDRTARAGKSHLPFCITSDQWVQTNRPFLPRTVDRAEYEESFHTLVTVPFLRSMMPISSLEKAHLEVLGRLARYENMSPQLALQVISDRQFMLSVAEETASEKVEEKIESKFVDIAKQLQQEEKKAKEYLKQKDIQIKEKDEEIKKLSNKLIVREQVKVKDEAKLKNQIEILRAKFDKEKEKSSKTDKQLKEIHNEFSVFKRIVRWWIFVGILIVASLCLWMRPFFITWDHLDTNPKKTVIHILLQLLLVFVLLNIPLKRHWKTWLIGAVIPLFIAIAILF